MEKRGAMMMPVIISVVGIALFLVVIIIFFGGIPWKSAIDKEACHNSVVQRATFNAGPWEIGKDVIPLKCKTEKVCITKSGEHCDDFQLPTRKNPVTEVKIKRDEETRIAVMDQIADSMYDCHKMLGEGKINFMPHESYEENYCLICARLAFDDEVKQEVQKVPYGSFYRHLQQKKDPNGKNYLSYIYTGWEGWQASEILFEEIKKQDSEKQNPALKDMEFEDWAVDLSQENGYVIVTQMRTNGRWKQYAASLGTGGTVALAGIIIGGAIIGSVFTGGLSLAAIPAAIGIASTGVAVAAAGVAGGTVLGGAVYVVTNPEGFTYTAPTIYPYDIETLNSLDCTSFETAP